MRPKDGALAKGRCSFVDLGAWVAGFAADKGSSMLLYPTRCVKWLVHVCPAGLGGEMPMHPDAVRSMSQRLRRAVRFWVEGCTAPSTTSGSWQAWVAKMARKYTVCIVCNIVCDYGAIVPSNRLVSLFFYAQRGPPPALHCRQQVKVPGGALAQSLCMAFPICFVAHTTPPGQLCANSIQGSPHVDQSDLLS